MTTRRPPDQRTVAEVMTTDLLTVTAEETVPMAWELMCRARVHHLPVVDGGGRCLGVVDAATLTATWEPSSPLGARRAVTTLLPRRGPMCVRPEATLAQAAAAMLAVERDYVTVIGEHGELVGLVTARDLVAALAGVPGPDRTRGSCTPSMYRIEPVLPERRRHTAPHSAVPPD
ncbi:CBS domain-containing protein [Actinomadura keratinilytica]|uniref:CBS domain-containing protein n=1 Tax=Actinomadura keratinilytica TaxID=547461 RepID=A0ABP7Z4U6_9ACTN